VIILLTDGVDTTSQKANYVTSLVEAERAGAVIFPFYFDSYQVFSKNQKPFPITGFGINTPKMIGATKAEYDLGRAYLHDSAALSGGTVFAVKSLSETKKEDFEAVLKLINPQYYISIKTAGNDAAFQRKQIKVRVMRPKLTVQARGSYISGKN
jgi:hypothetical protein